MTTKRKHRNTSRLTAKERAREFMISVGLSYDMYPGDLIRLTKAFGSHARDTLARYRRREARK